MAGHSIASAAADAIPSSDPAKVRPLDIHSAVTSVQGTIAQALGIMDMIAFHGELSDPIDGAVRGAATVIRSALAELEQIELAACSESRK